MGLIQFRRRRVWARKPFPEEIEKAAEASTEPVVKSEAPSNQ